MNALCLVVDRLHIGHIGAYGNTWIQTPSLDRLASESLVLDQTLLDSPRLENLCYAYWQGLHGRSLGNADLLARPSLPEVGRASGRTTTLLTDEGAVLAHPLAQQFGDVIALPDPASDQVATSLEATHLAHCFARLIDHVESAKGPYLTWCHLAGLGRTWDGPMEFRQQYVDPEDPPLTETCGVPSLVLEPDYDPDFLLAICQAYAGQVSVLDACVGALLELFDNEAIGQETLLCLIGARGFPLGEHHVVGAEHDLLQAELIHVPWMIRFPDRAGALLRSQTLVQPPDLYATLASWLQSSEWDARAADARDLRPLATGVPFSPRDRVYVHGGPDQQAIRTPAWFLRDGPTAGLFVKPDDRWEFNDVAGRCPDIVARLRDAMDATGQALRHGQPPPTSPLEDVLMFGLD